MSRLHSLLLIIGRTTTEQKVGAFLLHITITRRKWHNGPNLTARTKL
jgi:hypothetical protein